jgi:hypothetical protein
MPVSESPAMLHSTRISIDTDTESSDTQPLLDHEDDALQDEVSVRRSAQWERHAEPSYSHSSPTS